MNLRKSLLFSGTAGRFLSGAVLAAALSFASPVSADPAQEKASRTPLPFGPGEKLTYAISWSNLVSAGTATMSVEQDRSGGGDHLKFISTARSVGIVEKFYRVDDRVWSLFDQKTRQPLRYGMSQSHGKRKKSRELTFDHDQRKVAYAVDGVPGSAEVPGQVQDALSSLYVLRTQETFSAGRPIIIDIFDSGKNWAVEIYVLGKERIRTPAGEFDTIKVKTYPKYEGVFMHKGEIYMWLTDDRRRIPVLMKSTITIGSIMATLTAMTAGTDAP